MDAPAKINARLDDTTRLYLDELMQSTGGTVSDVVRESIAHYHAHCQRPRPPLRHFGALIGSGRSGRHDVASDVKRELDELLEAKWRLPPARQRRGTPR